jgi:UPF0755 protein
MFDQERSPDDDRVRQETPSPPCRSRTRRPLGDFVGGVFNLGILVLVAGLLVIMTINAPGPLSEQTVVQVERGASSRQIAAQLVTQGVIRDASFFLLAHRLLPDDDPLKAGEYAFAPGVTLREVVAQIRTGATFVRRITIPEGLSSHQIVAMVTKTDGLSGRIDAIPAEGTLLPETYYFSRGEQRQALIDRMRTAMEATVARLWDARPEELPINSPAEAVILASIVEKETGVAGERALVASVFLNRLRLSMRLQSDPTVIYGITEGARPLGRALTRADWRHDSRYNTYRIGGLPPGPIANPGQAALAAVFAPAVSDYLYFVADGTGGHAFAETLAEHNRNVAAWRRIRDGG